MSDIDDTKRRIVCEVESLAWRLSSAEHEVRRLKTELANAKAHARRMEKGRHAAEAKLKAAGILGPALASGNAPALGADDASFAYGLSDKPCAACGGLIPHGHVAFYGADGKGPARHARCADRAVPN